MGALCKGGKAKPLSSLFPNTWASPQGGQRGVSLSAAGQELSKCRGCDCSPAAVTGALLLKSGISCSIPCSSCRGLFDLGDAHSWHVGMQCSEAG